MTFCSNQMQKIANFSTKHLSHEHLQVLVLYFIHQRNNKKKLAFPAIRKTDKETKLYFHKAKPFQNIAVMRCMKIL